MWYLVSNLYIYIVWLLKLSNSWDNFNNFHILWSFHVNEKKYKLKNCHFNVVFNGLALRGGNIWLRIVL